jgi:hypothetical protein
MEFLAEIFSLADTARNLGGGEIRGEHGLIFHIKGLNFLSICRYSQSSFRPYQ